MAEKDNSKQARVTVHGQYTTDAAIAGVRHRLYCYHVSIAAPGRPQAKTYDRVLHIHELGVPGPAQHEPVASCPPQTADGVANAATTAGISRHPDTSENEYRLSPTGPAPRQKPPPSARECVMAPVTQDHPAVTETPAARPARPPLVYRTRFNGLPLTPALASLKTRLNQSRRALQRFLPGLRRRIRFPAVKHSPGRRLFNHRVGLNAGRGILLMAGVGLVGLLFYLRPDRNPIITTPAHNTVAASATDKAQAKVGDKGNEPPAYHARIEKNPDGVVITLQGPETEQVLTRLPPGYHPVVQGDKIVHIVTPGNTLWFIAKRYIKNPFRYPELVRLNDIKNPDLIYPGERVIIQYISKPSH